MKKFLLVILFLSFACVCFADVTAEIIGTAADSNGNILVKTQYKIDGVQVESNYPQDAGKYYYVVRYTVLDFAGLNETQKIDRVKQDITPFGRELIRRKYLKDENAKMDCKAFVGQKVSVTNTTIKVNPTTEWVVSTDGEKIEKVISADLISE